jgi:DNA-binding SARP family transcriptional activator
MRFKLLGPLQVTADDGQLIPIQPPQLRGLLTVLLLNANSPVSAGQAARIGECVTADDQLKSYLPGMQVPS